MLKSGIQGGPVRIAIAGPGAIGCLLAVRLAESGHAVVLLDRDPARAGRLARSGIELHGRGGARTVALPVFDNPSSVPGCDFFCLCVKAFDTARALRHWRDALGRCACVVSFQNGLGNAEACAVAAGEERVLCAATACGAERLAEGVVREAGRGDTAVAPWRAEALQGAEAFALALQAAGFETQIHRDAPTVLWSKLVVNAAVNPVTALGDVPNGALLGRPDLHRVAAGAAREAQAVALAAGVKLLFADAVQEMERVCLLTADNVSSMLQDVRARRRTEICAITGAVVDAARRHGVAVPINEDLLRRVQALEPPQTSLFP
jgi:2-dehydropantoate 2-reductase